MKASLDLFTWLANESSVMNLFPTGITAIHFCSLHLYKHIMVITALQNYLQVLVLNCQPQYGVSHKGERK